MPYLKFSRDRRGYESTYLLHASRRQGGERPKLLYWFRTPPHVKVGRAAFDEEAIRALEEHHPDLTFDWKHILQARPPAAPEPRDREGRAPRKPERGERKGREARKPSTSQVPAQPVGESPAPIPEPEEIVSLESTAAPEPTAGPTFTPAEAVSEVAAGPPPAEPPFEPPAPQRRLVRVFDVDPTPPPPVEHHATDPPMVNQILGDEAAELLRARHAELLARIATRVTDPARAEALREQAERLNPDTWVTEEDVRTGAAQAESLHQELRRLVGGRRRRRRRRSRVTGPGRPEHSQTVAPAGEEETDGPEDDAGAEDPDVS
ncbi:MAG TPA: hypothetical protein VF198_04195 [Vicinamibacterales bacterium]